MTNSEIVEVLELTAKLLELHQADPFKIKGYSVAAFYLDKFNDAALEDMTAAELTKLQGVGKSTAAKIVEIAQTGTFAELDTLLAKTPPGVLDMFKIKGIGAKKIAVLWRELGIDNLHELELACLNGSVAKVKGFGGSTQQKILDSLAFVRSQEGKLRMDKGRQAADRLMEMLKVHFERVEVAGDVRRKNEVVASIVILVEAESPKVLQDVLDEMGSLQKMEKESSPFVWRGKMESISTMVEIVYVVPGRMVNTLFLESAGAEHLAYPTAEGGTLRKKALGEAVASDQQLYESAGLPYIIPEMRDGGEAFLWSEKNQIEQLVTWDGLKGILHNHSTYSDGQHTLKQMADYCQELGFEYLGIADHSQTATYAQGLKEEDVVRQHEEIDRLNLGYAEAKALPAFKILKGIESDILGDGSLDYPDQVLASFDYVVASVHSNLTMSAQKATERVLKAVENPYTTVLGHPTGRLLLTRLGYPLDHRVIIDACAKHGVVVEINASPWRLDLDWRWIRYCMDQGVLLSINPDAHAMAGYFDMHYGVEVARKGGLTLERTFNAFSLGQMEAYLKEKASKRG
ncbi:DNA polymerase (family 10) [Dyadobacter jejuensis]|uniref:DNA polymerase (Family 10) n=1 Tax=Dyadobacter jejuensis TaxID=1082580 RepID=A0A316B6Y6_9BACT|nr:DNA polymerase/3'-5' exonuclease PolX [Dyadobacter jejuensis]PWJ58327.1 DNA polymerase (family 10) [Dyadobacter jejuensis]